MPAPLHDEFEMGVSRAGLPGVLSAVPEPACLVGGWAVYYTVDAGYRAATGRSYHGSTDIDLGFHVEEGAPAGSLGGTALARACRSLEERGFRGMGSRLFREYHRETRLPLQEAAARRTPSHNLFHLYVDLLVDNAPEGAKREIGFAPFDEKLLAHVFEGGMYRAIDEFPSQVIIPAPQVLLAMKMSSLPGRTKDHKKHKDIMDAYALIWHSGVPLKKLYSGVSALASGEDVSRAVSSIGGPDYEQAAGALGVDPEGIEAVMADFAQGASAGGGALAVGAGPRRRGQAPAARPEATLPS